MSTRCYVEGQGDLVSRSIIGMIWVSILFKAAVSTEGFRVQFHKR